MLKTYLLLIDRDLRAEEQESYMRFIAADSRERVKKFRRAADARRALLGEVLTARIAGGSPGETPARTDYGKPYIPGRPGFHFNRSHAGRYVALAVDDEPVGIDVEEISRARPEIAGRFFAADETEYIFSRPAAERARAFCLVWTMKESYVKREGRGLVMPLASFSVFGAEAVFFHEITCGPDAICHVCTSKSAPPQEIFLTLDGLARC
ncbi:MAG: 4'-phosphopantetheinyl transferase superfamily protein [Gracilibacteraceae bacterium]|jgi:4'-phosphopantetheinyl transferase|nr:4'-phosphopantetheinyl transferase superfamily protein [Gracilibacteraceae bacterium]